EVDRLRASSRRYDATTWLSPESASPIERTLARSYMLVDKKSTNNNAPRLTAITTYQKRESSILVSFPRVDLRGRLGDGDGHVGECSEHEGAWSADRRAGEKRLHRVLAGRKLGDDERAQRRGIGDGRHVRLDDDPASDARRELVP